jgi:hypothetical protein
MAKKWVGLRICAVGHSATEKALDRLARLSNEIGILAGEVTFSQSEELLVNTETATVAALFFTELSREELQLHLRLIE